MPIDLIDNPRDPRVRRVADVLRAQAAPKRLFVIDDEENLQQALAAGVELDTLFIAEDSADDAAIVLDAGAPVLRLADAVAKDLFGREKRSRVFALAVSPKPAKLAHLLGRDGDILVLDGVRLAGNIGAITRTATALGAAGIVLLDSGLGSVLDRRLVRASRGTVFSLPVILAERATLATFLQEHQIPLAALSAGEEAVAISGIGELIAPIALLMGSERTGASAELTAAADRTFVIPMDPGVESLNVSVAAGIALYERRR